MGNHTQFDADSDAIPDTYEREVAGGLSALGAQDSDLDGVLDVIEFAAGSDPRDGRSIPGGQMETASGGEAILRYYERELPTWLSLNAEFSTDLQQWGASLPGATTRSSARVLGQGLREYEIRISPTGEELPRVFSRLRVHSSQAAESDK
ncbi:hypothetical protein ACFSW8_00095 [Rubritalea tangerina]|uniref:Uncharacterized protein n=1 Tax=Rubritalea tangerina TaxID=430798 RepID=A0ABW4Z662_9BACT